MLDLAMLLPLTPIDALDAEIAFGKRKSGPDDKEGMSHAAQQQLERQRAFAAQNGGAAMPSVTQLTREQERNITDNVTLFTLLYEGTQAIDKPELTDAMERGTPSANPMATPFHLIKNIDRSDAEHPVFTVEVGGQLRHFQLVAHSGTDLEHKDKQGQTNLATLSGYKGVAYRELSDDGNGHYLMQEKAEEPLVILHGGARFPPTDPHNQIDWTTVANSVMGIASPQMRETHGFLDKTVEEWAKLARLHRDAGS